MSGRSSLCARVHAALIAVAAALVVAAPAEAQAVIGGQLSATGGTVDVVVQPGTAAFTSRLFLLGPDGTPNNIALNTEVGKRVTVGPFPAGRELVFGITVLDGGPTYFMGPASRNPDGIAHADVTETGVATFLVGFEDQFGGGDGTTTTTSSSSPATSLRAGLLSRTTKRRLPPRRLQTRRPTCRR